MLRSTPETDPPLQKHLLRGSLWAIALRWAVRAIGLVSTVILARLLTPADYGIVAIAMLIVGTVETFSNTGQHAALIRHPNPTREHYDSVWTISVLLGLFLGAIILAAVPLTVGYFNEPRAAAVVEILALRTAFLGFQNVGIVNFQRDFEFHRQFRFNVYSTLFSFAATVMSAFLLRNYWALVIGIMSKQAAIVVLSFTMQSYRPSISFAKVGEIWSFSIWTLLKSVGIHISAQIDKLSIGSFGGATAMGRYDVAQDVSSSPVQELVAPMVAVLSPVMAKVQDDHERRRALYMSVLYVSAIICASISVGMALVASDLVDVVLGPQWSEVKPLLPWLALSYGVLGLASGVYSAFDTLGKPMVSARLQWICLIILSLVIFPVGYQLRELETIAAARFAVSLLLTPMLFYALGKALKVRPRDFLMTLRRPFAASLVMAIAIASINSVIEFDGAPRLMIDIALGASVFVSTLLALWLLSGRPEGPEQVLWAAVNRRAAPLLRK